jgi:hypothetical protein
MAEDPVTTYCSLFVAKYTMIAITIRPQTTNNSLAYLAVKDGELDIYLLKINLILLKN